MPAQTLGGALRRRLHARVILPIAKRAPLEVLLADPGWRRRVVTELRDRQTSGAELAARLPAGVDRIRGFEDCHWLFEDGPLSLAVTQLRLDEAADLYRRVAALPTPRVAELGRFKGGTTVLLAAAGAEVLSLDNDAAGGQDRYLPELRRVLRRLGLDERVEAVTADAAAYPVEPEAFDLVLMHCSPDYELAWTIFRRWWPALRPDGLFVFHDTPELPGEARMIAELRGDEAWPDVEFEPDRHGENVYARKVRVSAVSISEVRAAS